MDAEAGGDDSTAEDLEIARRARGASAAYVPDADADEADGSGDADRAADTDEAHGSGDGATDDVPPARARG